jgi:hypothetical protein
MMAAETMGEAEEAAEEIEAAVAEIEAAAEETEEAAEEAEEAAAEAEEGAEEAPAQAAGAGWSSQFWEPAGAADIPGFDEAVVVIRETAEIEESVASPGRRSQRDARRGRAAGGRGAVRG